MKFKLDNCHYNPDKGLIHLYKAVGFTFNENDCINNYETVSIEINTIEDLIKLIEHFEFEVIVSKDTIKIYDGYNE